ncbi:phosphoglycerate dehydrogenase [Paenibacillus sp. JCM 10914]|uniref:D-2-hydroxyacid dehydrogenase n=1 Tax=Paenibacillus sp. JCM 10914 TaxID=1236974 RepID=UPI0003CC6170|nr:D-2-hydroxyacid dehydrogenase [Paenibacillus sp. JCM 10914]GAE07295.1 D-3-phosphoglycerate dehydrogenase [Paenibacillus sp. JCM 10914]
MPKILAIHELTTDQQQRIKDTAPGFELEVINAKDLELASLKEIEILIGWSRRMQDEVLLPDSKLKWIQAWSAGVDKMPLEEFEEKGIQLTNASGVHSIPITEHILAMILGFARNIHLAVRQQSDRSWDPAGTFSELHDKTIVIVGVGQIGSHTARVAQAFGLRTVGVRNSGKSDPYIDVMYKVDDLDKALSEGDYIVNILPLTDDTQGMFNKDRFAAMKDSAFFVNVGRGPTVVTDDLLEALTSGKLAGAGLDVFEEEPLPSDHPLWGLHNVIITPHTAGNTERYAERTVEIFLDNLAAYVKGDPLPRNVIDYNKEY